MPTRPLLPSIADSPGARYLRGWGQFLAGESQSYPGTPPPPRLWTVVFADSGATPPEGSPEDARGDKVIEFLSRSDCAYDLAGQFGALCTQFGADATAQLVSSDPHVKAAYDCVVKLFAQRTDLFADVENYSGVSGSEGFHFLKTDVARVWVKDFAEGYKTLSDDERSQTWSMRIAQQERLDGCTLREGEKFDSIFNAINIALGSDGDERATAAAKELVADLCRLSESEPEISVYMRSLQPSTPLSNAIMQQWQTGIDPQDAKAPEAAAEEVRAPERPLASCHGAFAAVYPDYRPPEPIEFYQFEPE